jgi:hypothetical protein
LARKKDVITGSFGFTSPPARGLSGTQIFSTTRDSSGIAGDWFKLQADADGPLLVTTEGSEIATDFHVYNGPVNAAPSELQAKAFTYSGSAPTVPTRRIVFTAQSNTVYYIQLDGVSQYGKVRLSWVLDYQPAIQPPPGVQVGRADLQVTNTAFMGLQWFFNDTLLQGQSSSNLTVLPVVPSSEGDYSVVLTNLNHQVTRDKVFIPVLPVVMAAPRFNGNATVLRFGSTYGRAVEILSSSNLSIPSSNWTSIYTNSAPGTNNVFADPQPRGTRRFYRLDFR